jgi:hypothetical protein
MLVSIGLIYSQCSQYYPVLGSIFWKGATGRGICRSCGWICRGCILLLPALARSAGCRSLFWNGPFGIELLRPLALFGLTGLDQITHAMIWSMIANIGLYVGVSLASTQSAAERRQASLFVDAFQHEAGGARFWRGTASAATVAVLARFTGRRRTPFADTRGRVAFRGLTKNCADGVRPLRRDPVGRKNRPIGARRVASEEQDAADRRSAQFSMKRRRSSSTAIVWNRSRTSSKRRPPNCAPPTRG